MDRAEQHELLRRMLMPAVSLLLGVLGFGLTLALMASGGAFKEGSLSRDFLVAKEGFMWLLALCVQGAAWTVIGGPLVMGILERFRLPPHPDRVRRRVEVGSTAFAGALLVFGPALFPYATGDRLPVPVTGHATKMLVLAGFGAFVVALLFGLLAVVDVEARRIRRTVRRSDTAVENQQLTEYLRLREALDGLLVQFAVLMTMAVLSAGLLLRAVQVLEDKKYSPEMLWPYALYLAGALALAYVPTHTRLLEAGEDMRDACYPPTMPDDDAFETTKTHREAMDELLGLHEGTGTKLKSSLVIVAPLFGTFVSTIVGK